MTDCLFCRMVAGEIPTEIVLETETVLAFRDIDPKAPTHVLVIPKEHYANAAEMAQADPTLAGEVLQVAGQVAQAEGISDDGYRLVFNTGSDGGQVIFHVHGHVLGGRSMQWPPG